MKPIRISVDLECWYHSDWFDFEKLKRKYKITTSIREDTSYILQILRRYNVKITFFVLSNLIKEYGDLIKTIHEEGHEIASYGASHANLNKIGNAHIAQELKESKSALESLINDRIFGFRSPCLRFPQVLYNFLSKAGYFYNSSVVPSITIPGWYGNPRLPLRPFRPVPNLDSRLFEFPISVLPVFRFPSNGGWFLRNVGKWWINAITSSNCLINRYSMLYLHPWEFSDHNPDYPEIGFHVFRRTGSYLQRFLVEYIERYKLANEDLRVISLYNYLESEARIK